MVATSQQQNVYFVTFFLYFSSYYLHIALFFRPAHDLFFSFSLYPSFSVFVLQNQFWVNAAISKYPKVEFEAEN